MNTDDQKPKLQVVPPAELSADEQALLTAYRSTDDRGRRETLRTTIRKAEMWPAPDLPGPRLIARPADERALIRDFRSMDVDAQRDVSYMVAAMARENPAKKPQPPLRLIAGGRA
jgi:hypothetical protein